MQHAFVFIHLNGAWVPAGYLEMIEDGRNTYSTFSYGKKYLQRGDAVPVDPVQLPLKPGEMTSLGQQPLFGALRDVSPDGWGRHLLDTAADPKRPTEFDYLTALNIDDRVGALAFGSDPTLPPHVFIPEWADKTLYGDRLNLEEMIQVADQIEEAEEIPPEHRRFLVRGSSFGGAQPKAPTTLDGVDYIAKFGKEREAWDTCHIEHATMCLAQQSGIDVPETKVISVAGRKVFLIRRFDRSNEERKHIISAATMVGRYDFTQGSYLELADAMRKYCVAKTLKNDLKQLFKRMFFNMLCSNKDDHLRNHSFYYDTKGKGWRLTPAYDIVPQPSMGAEDPNKLCLEAGKEGRSISISNALSQAARFGLPADEAKRITDEQLSYFKKNWGKVYLSSGVPEKDFTTLKEAFVLL